ncbi:MAG TPA: chromosomal replication initiator protein DnaA [Roseiarcus sp.]|nr:chromosomal replication initiator protein DnaA [Roseiarcus sp.]
MLQPNDDFPNRLEAWKRCTMRLRAELGEDVYSSWFGRLELDEIVDGEARLSVPTKFLKSWIDNHYTDRILAAMKSEFADVVALTLSVRSSTRPALSVLDARPKLGAPESGPIAPVAEREPPRPSGKRDAPASEEAMAGSPLDRRLTFATFLVGKSNQLAYSAAQKIIETRQGQPPAFSPLYIHAAVGLGKTHLLQAVAHAATSQGRRAIYLTAERFMYGFVAALRAQTAIAFKEALRSIDLLIFDDAQFLQGRSIQNEFCHALNALVDAGRQVVVAADRPPNELESLEERVRSRLAGGLCVEMGALDEALRVKILEARVAAAQALQPGFDVAPPVLAYVAKTINSNGRDLEGAVNRLLAHSSIAGQRHTVESAEVAIRDLVRTREPKRVKIEDIQKLVANRFSVTRADILSARRTATVVKPRQIAMYLAKVLTPRSLPEIGRRFGGRDHTTVLHAVRKIEGLAKTDANLNEELELLKRMLLE